MVDGAGNQKTYPEEVNESKQNVTILPIKFVRGDNDTIAYFAQSDSDKSVSADKLSFSLMAIPL